MNIQQAINGAVNILKKSNIKTPQLDSELILSKVIKQDRKYIILNHREHLNEKNLKDFKKLILRRKKGEPIAYITNYKEFWKNEFYVNKNVLIPRPDTEILVEQILKIYDKTRKIKFLDIGTGSGCLLLSILKDRENFSGIGIDISKKALKVARFNAKLQHLVNRVKFYNSDIDKFFLGKYDLILSNPPYIKKFNLKYLDRDVAVYEPNLALNGGNDGLSEITKVINKASNLIKKNGKLILEIGCYQRNEVVKKLKDKSFYINKIVKDYGKNDRCIISTKI
tara:strand:- start:1855 stop:2697 length:843 start_codon:yes stop_codon:yes gene_type:complete